MHSTFEYPTYAFKRPPEMDADHNGAAAKPYPLIIVGAGPVGMAAALDARRHGLPALILDDDHTVSVGSRGLCYAKRTLDILDRLGVGDAVVHKGVTWNVGRTFFGEREVFNFKLLAEPDHRRPGMVNLQQYYLEHFQVQAAGSTGWWRCGPMMRGPRWTSKHPKVPTPCAPTGWWCAMAPAAPSAACWDWTCKARSSRTASSSPTW